MSEVYLNFAILEIWVSSLRHEITRCEKIGPMPYYSHSWILPLTRSKVFFEEVMWENGEVRSLSSRYRLRTCNVQPEQLSCAENLDTCSVWNRLGNDLPFASTNACVPYAKKKHNYAPGLMRMLLTLLTFQSTRTAGWGNSVCKRRDESKTMKRPTGLLSECCLWLFLGLRNLHYSVGNFP